ncbi:MAG TPA: YdcF family protein [Vicinamibacterales bacterium]|nr:YdcF family protein [Vicinamibacterales bacterium]
MTSVLDFLKATSRLSSLPLIVVMFGVGIALLYGRRTARAGRRWLTCVWIGFWLLTTPAGSQIIAWPLSTGAPPIQSRADARGATAVVMLGGGTISHVANGIGVDDLGVSALRIVETVRVYRLLDRRAGAPGGELRGAGAPGGENVPLVILSGGDTQHMIPPRTEASAYRDAAIKLGVRADRIVVEDRSQTTRDEALLLKPLLAERHVGTFVLVTSPTHMPRSLLALRAVGLDPIPSPAPARTASPSRWSLVPDRESLAVSDGAIYDACALVYYWLRGWL